MIHLQIPLWLYLKYFSSLKPNGYVSWGKGVPHVLVTHTPLATVSIFNMFLILKSYSLIPAINGEAFSCKFLILLR